MHAFLILSENQKFLDNEINKIQTIHKISPFDIKNYRGEKSFGIDLARKIIRDGSMKPYSGTKKLIVINAFHTATLEAQNAMLKFVEEPPESTLIVIQADSQQGILPTILSRCIFIRERDGASKEKNELQKVKEFTAKILKSNSSYRLILAEEIITSRKDAEVLLKQLLSCLEYELLNKSLPLSLLEITQLIKKVRAAENFLERNVNFRLVTDILFLGFPHIPSS